MRFEKMDTRVLYRKNDVGLKSTTCKWNLLPNSQYLALNVKIHHLRIQRTLDVFAELKQKLSLVFIKTWTKIYRMKCLILGSSGATGQALVKLLLSEDQFISKIICLNRRPLNVIKIFRIIHQI